MSIDRKQDPNRPFFRDNERENNDAPSDKDHLSDEPSSDELANTGEQPLHADKSLDRDAADE